MKISVIYPSRGRPEQAKITAEKWITKAYNAHLIEWKISLDGEDPKLLEYGRGMGILSNHIIHDGNKGCVDAINKAAARCSGDLFVVISDDFDCPLHWDTLLLEALKDKSDFCVKTQDGFQKVLMTLPIMDRAYYNRFGYIYNPVYKHWYADQEMTAVAMMLGRNINIDMEFTHNHYLAGKGTKDVINERNDLSRYSGKEIYNQRVKENFGIVNPVMAYNQIKWKS